MSLHSLRGSNRRRAVLSPNGNRQTARHGLGRLHFEQLEHRRLLTVTSVTVEGVQSDNSIQEPAGKNLFVPIVATDDGNDAISYAVTSSNSAVTVSVVPGDTYLTLNVSGTDNAGTAYSGALTFKLFDQLTPQTVGAIKSQVAAGDFNNTTFARVLNSLGNILIAQGNYTDAGAAPAATNAPFDDEFNSQLTFDSPGMLAWANFGPDTNDLQFFVSGVDAPGTSTALTQANLAQTRALDYRYTIFGQLVDGWSTFNKMMNSTLTTTPSGPDGTTPDKPVPLISVSTASVITDNVDTVLDVSAPTNAAGQSSTISITATENNGAVAHNTFTVNVVADTVIDPPFLGAISSAGVVSTSENTPVTITLPITNPDGATVTTEVVAQGGGAPANVTVGAVNTSTGQVTLTPASGFTGTISLLAEVAGTNSDNTHADTQPFSLTINAPGTPNPPTNLTLSVASANEIDLSWTAAAGAVTGYNVFRGTTAGGESTTPLNSTPLSSTTTSFQDTTATSGSTFFYVVQAINGTASSPNSNEQSAKAASATSPAAPTGLALDTSSETGLLTTDNYTSQATPVLDATTTAGNTVVFSVNGQSFSATANSSGLATTTLPAGTLAVGANSVTATASNASGSSTTSPVMTVTYAPGDLQVYTVPGAIGSSQTLTVTWTSRQAAYNDEIGVYEVTSATGTVDGIAPGSAGYAKAAIGGTTDGGQFAKVVFPSGDTGGETMNLTVTGGEQLAFYMIQNNTTANFMAKNPTDSGTTNNRTSQPTAFFTTTAANPDTTQHVQVTADPTTGTVQYAWEDMMHGDFDYNDVVMTVGLSSGNTASPGTLHVPDAGGGNISLSATLASGTHDSTAPGDVGVYFVDNPSGDIGTLTPSSAGYLAAALASGNSQVLIASGTATGAAAQSITVPAGKYIAFYAISSGTTANFLSANPTNGTTTSGLPNAFLSFPSANPNQTNHFNFTSPEGVTTNPSQTQLHVMDQLLGSDTNFDDLDLDMSFIGG